MKVTHISCGPAVNESESKALVHLKSRLESIAGDGEWILLTNLAFSVNPQLQADEIDIVVIGPPGIRVLEVKHWDVSWMNSQPHMVAQEADKVTRKARRVGTTLRRYVHNLPSVDGAFLLTRDALEPRIPTQHLVRGVRTYILSDWKEAIDLNALHVLSGPEIRNLARILEPRSIVTLDKSLRRFGGYVNLEILTPIDGPFHRVYKGVHSVRQDRVILHLYDLSASDDRNSKRKAEREWETLRILQSFAWAPRVLDSFQEAPGYPGEMFFFTVIDPAAPTLAERSTDGSWSSLERIRFARNAVHALAEMHAVGTEMSPVLHRNITPGSLLVKYDTTPILTGFHLAKIPADVSVGSISLSAGKWV